MWFDLSFLRPRSDPFGSAKFHMAFRDEIPIADLNKGGTGEAASDLLINPVPGLLACLLEGLGNLMSERPLTTFDYFLCYECSKGTSQCPGCHSIATLNIRTTQRPFKDPEKLKTFFLAAKWATGQASDFAPSLHALTARSYHPMDDDNRISITVCGDGGCGMLSISTTTLAQEWH